MAGSTDEPGVSEASSTTQRPSLNDGADRAAISLARLDLPTPPGPVSVSTPARARRSALAASSSPRPNRSDGPPDPRLGSTTSVGATNR